MIINKKIKVLFPLLNKELTIDSEETIAKACELIRYPQNLVCGGKGTCGKCKVNIEKDGLINSVLACQEKVSDKLKIFISERTNELNILTQNSISLIDFNPNLRKIFLDKSQLKTPSCSGDWENICQKLDIKNNLPEIALLKKLPSLIHDKNSLGLTFIIWDDEVIHVEMNDTTDQLYGFAIDLGTTTVVAYVFNMITGEKLGTYSSLNGQISEGADVISRIASSADKPDGLEILQSKVIETINKLISSSVKELGIKNNSICEISICGNSVMQHLFLGISPVFLGIYPFTSVIQRDIKLKASSLNLSINPNGIVHFLPLIGGFVGADTSAVLFSLPKEKDDKLRLIIDIGTNGEIAVGRNNRYITASTAAGPALEGAGIHYGMRGTTGAIERMEIVNNQINLKVIGDVKPVGICGSGLIDAISELLRVGIINFSGKMLTKEEYLNTSNPEYSELANNLLKIGNINVFILSFNHDSDPLSHIYISQKDVRAVQLTKSAICTGCILLIKEFKVKGTDLDEILIAGAFGNYIDSKKGQYIGLLPFFEGVPIISIGNAAGLGTQKYLLSKDVKNNALPFISKIEHVELASNPGFQNEYIKNTYFPKY